MERPENLQSIADEIVRMAKADQEMRSRSADNKGIIENEDDDNVDIKNTKRMKEIVDTIGWPSRSKVGGEASGAAWLLVQHADHDKDFQRKCLELMKNLPEGDVDPRNIAYLEDRIRVNEGRPQVYGTQFYLSPKTGLYVPRPIENPDRVDKLRAKIGLESIAEYSKHWDEDNEEIKHGLRKF